MINNIFLMAKRMGLADWGMVYLGAQGTPMGKLSSNEVSSFACNELAKPDGVKDILLTAISEVAFCSEVTDEVVSYLRLICDEEHIDLNLSSRKWRYLSLKLVMDELPDDCVYGLLKLNEFWMLWGEDVGSPNIVQGVGNNISPTEYYSDEQYQLTIKNHQEWLEKEKSELASS